MNAQIGWPKVTFFRRNLLLDLLMYILELNATLVYKGAASLELENGSIIKYSKKYPPLIHDPFYTGTTWIMTKITNLMVDLETRLDKIL